MGSIEQSPPVWLSDNASERTKKLWWLHGHPHSKRFENPDLTSFGALLRHNAKVFGTQTAFLYPKSSDENPEYTEISWKEFDSCTSELASQYANGLKDVLLDARATGKQPTVALLGAGYTIEYFAAEMALQKLNLRVLLLAEKTNQIAVDHLVKITNVQVAIVDHQNTTTQFNVPVFPMIETLPLSRDSIDQTYLDLAFDDGKDAWERHSFIIHSSGSTGMPKPITHTNRSLMLIARMYRLFPEYHIENWFLLFPLFHIAGISIILSGLPNGCMSTLPPRSWPPRSSSILHVYKTVAKMGYPVECIHTAPIVIENLIDHIEQVGGDFSPLANLKVLQPGGAMLPATYLAKLVSKGVNVKTTYGTTEIGPPLRSIPHSGDNPECYRLANLYPENEKLTMEDLGDGLYECVIYNGFELAADLWDGPDDTKPYRTNDLFVQNPPGSGYFYLEGRRDDVLVHTSGENTNANPIETELKGRCNIVKSLVMLGHGRPCPSLLVELQSPIPDAKQEIWNVVKEVNKLYPRHSAVIPDMIYVLPQDQHLPVTPKGNVKRKEAERTFQSVVDELYSSLEQNTSTPARVIPDEQLAEVVRELVSKISEKPLTSADDNTSLYNLGIDSISAIRLRSELSKAIGKISLGTIFENPSVERLTQYFKKGEKGESAEAKNIKWMEEAIETYSKELQTWQAAAPKPSLEKECILLTGSSGSLGTGLLEKFAASSKVSKVYALINGQNPMARLKASMTARGMDVDSIFQENKIEVLSYNIKDASLGFSQDVYDALKDSVTTVIHGAWKMDFNMPVDEYKDCLDGVMHLMKFCLTGQTKTFAFVSSIAACLGNDAPKSVPETAAAENSGIPLSTGYGQSKYIVERICQNGFQHLNIPIRILRLGQMYGHSITGSWNTQEMFPIMIATSVKIGSLPILQTDQNVDWPPLDVAAGTMLDIVTESSLSDQPLTTHNIVNPHEISWPAFLDVVEASLKTITPDKPALPRIPMTEWVAKLRQIAEQEVAPKETTAADSDIKRRPDDLGAVIPGVKLLHFFENMASSGVTEEEERRVFQTFSTREISPSLNACEAVNVNTFSLSLQWWSKGGFL